MQKVLLLGVVPNVIYKQHEVKMEIGDFVVMMTDGVTECRTDEGFIEQEFIASLIHSLRHETAQTIVDSVFKELEKMQNFELRDDFTLVIFKKTMLKGFKVDEIVVTKEYKEDTVDVRGANR